MKDLINVFEEKHIQFKPDHEGQLKVFLNDLYKTNFVKHPSEEWFI
jgi:hypothetical protein